MSSVQAQPSNLSVHVTETKTGRRVCSAAVYLYHPPFDLGVAVDYSSAVPGAGASELFTPPPGWGVLRSSAGLLLWLRLESGGQLYKSSPQASDVLRLDFEAPGNTTVSVEATAVGSADVKTQLQLDEGLLHPEAGHPLQVRLGKFFDMTVKQWLSKVNRRRVEWH